MTNNEKRKESISKLLVIKTGEDVNQIGNTGVKHKKLDLITD